MSKSTDAGIKLVPLKKGGRAPCCRRLRGSGGKAPSRLVIFCNFLKNMPILMPLDHISSVLEPFEKN